MTIFFFIFNDFSPSRPLIYPPFPMLLRPLSDRYPFYYRITTP